MSEGKVIMYLAYYGLLTLHCYFSLTPGTVCWTATICLTALLEKLDHWLLPLPFSVPQRGQCVFQSELPDTHIS